jgi:hypothetical protein
MKRQVVILGAGFGGLELSTSRHSAGAHRGRRRPRTRSARRPQEHRARLGLYSDCPPRQLLQSGPRVPQKFDGRLPLNVNPPHQRSRVEHGRAAPAEVMQRPQSLRRRPPLRPPSPHQRSSSPNEVVFSDPPGHEPQRDGPPVFALAGVGPAEKGHARWSGRRTTPSLRPLHLELPGERALTHAVKTAKAHTT